MAPVILGYWDIRGLAQPIRLLLEYTGMEWEDKLYSCGPAPDYDKTCWFGIKESLGMDFPNLPYLFDGETKIPQSGAIMRYIARKHDLLGQSEDEKLRVDIIDAEINDFRSAFVSICYNPNFEQLKTPYLETLPKKLERLSKFLSDRPYFAGQNITFVDFIVYEMLDQHKIFEPTCLNAFENLQQFVNRIEALDKIAAYMKSPRFIKMPLNNKMAKFGGNK